MSFSRRTRALLALLSMTSLAACNAARTESLLPSNDVRVQALAMRDNGSIGDYGPKTYAFTGSTQTYAVPSGVTNVAISAWGGGSNGRLGGFTSATIPVTSGENLTVVVGGQGHGPSNSGLVGGAGGWGGKASGGNGGNGRKIDRESWGGSGGGGASYVAHASGSLGVVAGGAGGVSGNGFGGGWGGGEKGGDGDDPYHFGGGKGGTQSCGAPSGGGPGQSSVYGGGGAGGGYCGGSGGTGSRSQHGADLGGSGGGGGSGYFETGATGNPKTLPNAGSGSNGTILILPPPKIFDLASGFNQPRHLAVDKHGNVYVSDDRTTSIRMIATNGTVTQIGSGLYSPQGIAVDAQGDVYVADLYNKAVKKIAPPFNGPTHGTITIVDGGPKDPYLYPYGLALDTREHLYITAESRGFIGDDYWALRRYDLKSKAPDEILWWQYTRYSLGGDVALDPHCTPTPKQPCYIYVKVIGSEKIPFLREFYDNGSRKRDINIEKPGFSPDGSFAVNNNAIYVVSRENDAVDQIAGTTFTPIGSGWNAPYGLAFMPGCSTLCSVYVGETRGGLVRAWVP